MKKALLTILFLLPILLSAQITQTIRGTVIDAASKSPLPGANIRVLDTTQFLGATTDLDGKFKIKNVPVGRVALQVSFMGYETQNYNNLDLTSGKELVLNIELEESVIMADEVVIEGKKSGEVNNEMSTVSSRNFSVEASKRYAGSVNDVARMAQNFAGVQGNDDSRNDIIVRGNSPVGVLYRFEGIDIPNPNHFALLGTAGGPVSILNNNVLANSDFMTGAFPAEYGNAMAAVFDLKMRKGNNENHEFLGQIGFNGAELMAEGPLSKKGNASYLVSYRYSTLKLFSLMGVNFGTGTAVPDYQDVNLKLNWDHKNGSTSLFGIGGLSNVEFEAEEADESNNLFAENNEDLFFYSRIGVVGIKNIMRLNNKAYIKTTLSTSATYNNIVRDSIELPSYDNIPSYRNLSIQGKNNINTQLNYKFNARHHLRAGLVVDRLFFQLSDSLFSTVYDQWFVLTDDEGSAFIVQPFAQWQYKISPKITLNAGVHHQLFSLNNDQSFEPRLGLSYNFHPRHRIALGYGKHSQVAPMRIYFKQVPTLNGSLENPNQDVEMTRAHHYIISYNFKLRPKMQLKTELYYQDIYNVPVSVNSNTYSMLNFGSDYSNYFPDSLENGGTGTNYGIEITLEHFMDKGFYFLFTSSLYESKYTGSNGEQFSTAFNGNYTFNALGGKEFFFNNKKKEGKKQRVSSLVVDAKVTLSGGQRYTPIDLPASIEAESVVYDYSRTNEKQYPNYFRTDLRIAFKLSTKKITQEWAIDFRNLTNYQNIFTQEFNPNTGQIDKTYQIGFLPIGQWRIEF